MSMPEFELPEAKTPSRKSGTSCILRRPFSILLRYAHTTNSAAPAWRAAPTRSHSPSPWSDSDPGADATQGRPPAPAPGQSTGGETARDRKSTRLNSSHVAISYAVFCLKKKKHQYQIHL